MLKQITYQCREIHRRRSAIAHPEMKRAPEPFERVLKRHAGGFRPWRVKLAGSVSSVGRSAGTAEVVRAENEHRRRGRRSRRYSAPHGQNSTRQVAPQGRVEPAAAAARESEPSQFHTVTLVVVQYERSAQPAAVSSAHVTDALVSPNLSDVPFCSVNVPPTAKGKRTALTGAFRRKSGPSESLHIKHADTGYV